MYIVNFAIHVLSREDDRTGYIDEGTFALQVSTLGFIPQETPCLPLRQNSKLHFIMGFEPKVSHCICVK